MELIASTSMDVEAGCIASGAHQVQPWTVSVARADPASVLLLQCVAAPEEWSRNLMDVSSLWLYAADAQSADGQFLAKLARTCTAWR